jgi:ClpP class serine protease
VETGEGLFTGAFWVGNTAIGLGLADEIGDIRSVLRARFGEKVKLDVLAARRGFSLGRLIGNAAQALPDSALATIEERALWGRFGL